ncbi:MAG: HTTM domain-containing protein [Nannocystaceae bacterium]
MCAARTERVRFTCAGRVTTGTEVAYPERMLTPRQVEALPKHTALVLQFAQFLGKTRALDGDGPVSVYPDVFVGVNARRPRQPVREHVVLLGVTWGTPVSAWLTSLEDPGVPPMGNEELFCQCEVPGQLGKYP